MSVQTKAISTKFIWRRVHSLMGFWLVLYLTIHLITNSQAALWIGDDGNGFVRLVNLLERLPYLELIEIFLIGVPILIHGVWGVKRALEARSNSGKSDGSHPSLPYGRSRAFTLQRASSWILLVGILGHVVQMRFLDAPVETVSSNGEQYLVKLNFDEGLYTLCARMHVDLYTSEDIDLIKKELRTQPASWHPVLEENPYRIEEETNRVLLQKQDQERRWREAVSSFSLKKNQLVAASYSPGTAFLLMVRDTFKNPIMAVFYTLFVLASAFHAFNGFWTFLLTWGVILSYRSQKAMVPFAFAGFILISFLGLAAIWGSYWINLRY